MNPRGVSLVEVIVALTIFIIAILGIMGLLLTSGKTGVGTREETLAYQAVRAKLEEVRATSTYLDIFTTYNEDGSDDPDGVDTAPGPEFTVSGLRTVDGETNCGFIVFPVNTSGELIENDDNSDYLDLGMPLDLDASGGIEADVDKWDTYKILPVKVTIRWKGPNGDRSIDQITWITEQ